MALSDPAYDDSLRIAFTMEARALSADAPRLAGAGAVEYRRAVLDHVRAAVGASGSTTTFVGSTFAWHGDNIALWMLVGRGASGQADIVEGLSHSIVSVYG